MSDDDNAETFGINPSAVYRKYSKAARAIIGLGPTQTEQAIQNGELERPVPLTSTGTAVGWLGVQLIRLQRKRLAMAGQKRPKKRER